MSVNRGKQFENVIRKSFECVEGVSIDRINDNTAGFKGIAGICDFIVYLKPYQYYIECKTVHGNTLSIFGNDEKHKYGRITNKQWEGLLEKSKIEGVRAGLIVWWVDKDITLFIDIRRLKFLRDAGCKSIRYDNCEWSNLIISIHGKKKRVFFDYDMERFFRDIDGHTFLHNW